MSLFGKKDEREDAVDAFDAPSTAAQRFEPAPAPPAARGREREGKGDMANIGKSITISGDLTGEEDLVIEGKVEGKVTLPNSQLTIGANGTIKAEVQAKSVVVIGRVSGNVRGTERVEIQATGIVEGDVVAPRLVVAEGAVVNGSIQMTSKPGAATAHTAQGEPRRATGTAG
ncbi:MAG TPA: polymer-forming cytoskeletal protein [Myxococcota bacterium]|nr:polymer-forming cytoskeletal protein [Myxococcota bacterium]